MNEGPTADAPDILRRVADVMAPYSREWVLCGGWGVDAWLARQTREHLDVDLSIFDEDQAELHRFFGDGWLLNGHDPRDDDSETPWDGHRLELPAHVHARAEGFDLDFQVNRRDGTSWIVLADPPARLGLDRAIVRSAWGVPALAPEAIVLYKALGVVRPHDQADFEVLLPALDRSQLGWLREALAAARPDSPWLEAVSAMARSASSDLR